MMRAPHLSSIAAAILLASISQSSAMISLMPLTKATATERGITMKSRPNGDAGTMVWIEFKKEGVLKAFNYVDLRVEDAKGGHLISTRIDQNPVRRSQVADLLTFSFSAATSELAKCSFWVVAYGSTEGDVGFMLKVADFLDLKE